MSGLSPSQLDALARSTGLEPAEIEAVYSGSRTNALAQVTRSALAIGAPSPLDSSPIRPPPSRYAAQARGRIEPPRVTAPAPPPAAPRAVPPGYGSGPAYNAAMGGPLPRDLGLPRPPPPPKPFVPPPTVDPMPLPKLPGLPGGPDPFSSTLPVPPASGPDLLSTLRPRWPRGGGA